MGQVGQEADLAMFAAQAEVAVPAGEEVVRHERTRCGHHEAGADPQRVREAPQRLPECLRVPRYSHDPCLPQVQLRLIHRRHLSQPHTPAHFTLRIVNSSGVFIFEPYRNTANGLLSSCVSSW